MRDSGVNCGVNMAVSSPLLQAVILAVGSELLTPTRTDTNSLFLTQELNALGIDVRYKSVVGDEPDDLSYALRNAVPQADLIVVTGGLGPTADDITRNSLASVFDLSLHEDGVVAAEIRSRFKARGLQMPEINRCQAMVPDGAVVLANNKGTAPGLYLEFAEIVCVALPGPPRELRPMFRALAAEHLAPRCQGRGFFRRVLVIVGRTESHVEELVQPVYARWRHRVPTVRASILASLGQVELHLSISGDDAKEANSMLSSAATDLAAVLGKSLVSSDGSSLEEEVGRLLKNRSASVAVAESCTGGFLASRLTDVPGSSAYLHAGWIVYSDEAKTSLLGVEPEIIQDYGAVSEEVAKAMATGALSRANVDYALGLTGIAGPAGGSVEKPIGTVCVALAGPSGLVRAKQIQFPGERSRVKYQASQAALDVLRRALLE